MMLGVDKNTLEISVFATVRRMRE